MIDFGNLRTTSGHEHDEALGRRLERGEQALKILALVVDRLGPIRFKLTDYAAADPEAVLINANHHSGNGAAFKTNAADRQELQKCIEKGFN